MDVERQGPNLEHNKEGDKNLFVCSVEIARGATDRMMDIKNAIEAKWHKPSTLTNNKKTG